MVRRLNVSGEGQGDLANHCGERRVISIATTVGAVVEARAQSFYALLSWFDRIALYLRIANRHQQDAHEFSFYEPEGQAQHGWCRPALPLRVWPR